MKKFVGERWVGRVWSRILVAVIVLALCSSADTSSVKGETNSSASKSVVVVKVDDNIAKVDFEKLISQEKQRIKQFDFKAIKLNKQVVAAYEKVELSFDISATFKNGDQYNQNICDIKAYFIMPSGNIETIPAFYMKNTSPKWAVRYSPRAVGKYSYYLKDEKTGVKSKSASFTVKTAALSNRGFIYVEGNKLVDSRSKQFTILGTNVAWGTVREFEYTIPLYNNNSMNWARFWLQCPWSAYNLESKKGTVREGGEECVYFGLGDYSLGNASRLDKLIELFEKNNMYMQMCIFNLWDFDGGHWSNNAYNMSNGGPCYWTENDTNYWTHPIAIKYQQQLIRYIVSRWGYSRSIGMYEYWNECDNKVDTKKRATRDEWYVSMDNYLKSLDIYKRPTTTSYAWKDHKIFNMGGNATEPWRTQEFLDVANVHLYSNVGVDATQSWIDQLNFTAQEHPGDKPVYFGEYSEVDAERREVTPFVERFFADGIWTPIFFADSVGSNLYWRSSGSFIPSENMLKAMKNAARFIQPFENILHKMDFVYAGVNKDLRVGYYKGKDAVILYAKDEHSPVSVVDPRIYSKGSFEIADLPEGKYSLEFYDPLNGKVLKKTVLSTEGGDMKIDFPDFRRSIAVSVVRNK